MQRDQPVRLVQQGATEQREQLAQQECREQTEQTERMELLDPPDQLVCKEKMGQVEVKVRQVPQDQQEAKD